VNEIYDNMLVYTMDRPEDGGLDLESMGHYGDSGSGALLIENDELHIIGGPMVVLLNGAHLTSTHG